MQSILDIEHILHFTAQDMDINDGGSVAGWSTVNNET